MAKLLAAAREALVLEKRRVLSLEREAGPRTTPGTRVRWANLREWLDGWREIDGRPASRPKHAALRVHLETLPDEVVEATGARELDELHGLVNSLEVEPARGKRAGHATTRLPGSARGPANARSGSSASRPT